MSAEKERRYQELYKNRFVNPIDQGIGRRTGWVLNKEVRKDSEGFEVFDDYLSDSGESVDDLSLHANKENKRKPYKLSSPIKHMPDFTPSSRASTDVEPLSDVGPKAVTANSTLTKASDDPSKSVQANQARTEEEPLDMESENGIGREEDVAWVETTSPGREEGGIHESDITGSIIKGGNSFQVPNSALQEFKTKTRLSFGDDVADSPKRSSAQRTSSARSHSDDESASSDTTLKGSQSDTTLKGSQSDVDSEGIGTAHGEALSDKETLAVEAELGIAKEINQSVVEIAPDKELSGKLSVPVPQQEITAAPKQKPVRKSMSKVSGIPVKQTSTNGRQETRDTTRPTRRQKRTVRPVEEDQISGDEGMFISLHKPSASWHNGTETVGDAVKNALGDRSFHDADDEEMLEIVDNDRSYKPTLNTKAKSKADLKRVVRQSVSSKAAESASQKQSRKDRRKKVGKQDGPDEKDIIDLTSDKEVAGTARKKKTSEQQSVNGVFSKGSGTGVGKSRQVQPSKTSQSRKTAAGKNSLTAHKSSSDGEGECGTTDATTDRSKRRLTKTSQKNSSDAGGNEKGSKGTDDGEEDSGATTTDASKRNRSKRRLTKTTQKRSSSDTDGNERSSTGTDDSEVESGTTVTDASRINHPKKRLTKTSQKSSTSDADGNERGLTGTDDGEGESSTTATDALARNRPKRRLTKTFQRSSSSDADVNEGGSTRTDEVLRKSRRRKPRMLDAGSKTEKHSTATASVVEDRVDVDNTKTGRRRNKSVRGPPSIDSKTDEETGPDAGANNLEESDQEGVQSNTEQEKVSSFKQPPAASSRKSVKKKRASVHFSTVEIISDEASSPTAGSRRIAEKEAIKSSPPKQTLDVALDGGSPRKRFKGTRGGKLVQKRTSEIVVEAVSPKKQRGSLSDVRGGRKRGGKRKLYSGDFPSSFLVHPSVNDAAPPDSIVNADPTTAEDDDNSVGAEQENLTREAPVGAPSQGRVRGRGKGRGRGNTRGRGSVRRRQPTREAAQVIQVPENIVLNFLTKYESSKESESTDSDDSPPVVGVTESFRSDLSEPTTSTATPVMCTTVYPETTPRSILKRSTSDGVDTRKKNLTLQFFEVPKRKPIIVPPDMTENGLRRTRRNRVRPVEFWRNERAEYERRKSGGFVLVGVQAPQESSPELQTQRGRNINKGTKRLLHTPANLSMHVSPPPGSKEVDDPALVVINPDTQQEVEVDTLRAAKMNVFVGPSGKEATPDDPITLCKAISQKAFSSGILTIRPLSEKGMQFIQNDTMVFYITRGKVSVTIHNTTSILQNGDMFFVPQGNMYNIKNLRRDEAKLVFFQHKGR